MSKVRTVKLEDKVLRKLLKIGKDVNDSVKMLFLTLKNDAEQAGAEKVIESNLEMFKKNKAKIENLPKQKAEFEKDFNEKQNHQMKLLNHRGKIVETKLKNLGVVNPIYKWETLPEWQNLQKKEFEMELINTAFDIEALERKTKFIMEEEKQAENYDTLRINLEQQNDRLLEDNARFQRIIALCKKLDIELEDEIPTYVG